MYIQWFVKGVAGHDGGASSVGLSKDQAFDCLRLETGLMSNWWIKKGTITASEIAGVLNDLNLDRHIHSYATYGSASPFISLATGSVERNRVLKTNAVYSAVDTALAFATDDWARPGALFYGWTIVALSPAVALHSVSEAVGELNVYRRWSPYQLEGEVTAKVFIPANQIQCVEWWDGSGQNGKVRCLDRLDNAAFAAPDPIMNVRQLF